MKARAARLAVGLLATLAACSPAPDRSPSTPAPPRPATGPRVVLPSGQVIHVEIATTDDERARGLMFRESMAKDAGMVFLFDGVELRPFWMKNCHFPLDMVHLLKDGTVVDVLKNVPPCPADPCPSFTPKEKSDTVLELNAGVADQQGVKPGAKLRFTEIAGR